MQSQNPIEKLSRLLKTPLSGFGKNASEVSASIVKNLKNPIGSDMGLVNKVVGSETEFLSQYQNFEEVYKKFLKQELQSTLISSGERRQIQAAIDSPVINLRLIRNFQNRKQLTNMFRNDVLKLESAINYFRCPRA